MKERPILFNGEMVRAILDGRKTQTRRMLKGVPCFVNGEIGNVCPLGQVGDHLWVRETHSWCGCEDGDMHADFGCENILYKASEATNLRVFEGWIPSIHMPRWASRINLEITNIRIERLHRITEHDAKCEGADCLITKNCTDADRELLGDALGMPIFDDLHPYKNGFALQWDSIYKNWQSNPWVWVIEFKMMPLPTSPKE